MPVTPLLPADPVAGHSRELDALRAELRCILQHPAFVPARRAAAGAFISQCADAARLEKWLALAVAECADWEEQTLAAEGTPKR